MAAKIQAITTYGPRIIIGKQYGIKYVSEIISGRTSINPGSVSQALKELQYVISLFLRQGNSVKMPGIGTFSSSIKLDGKIKVNLKVDKELTSDLNRIEQGFTGEILHPDNIGKTSDELVLLWNTDHPDDLVA